MGSDPGFDNLHQRYSARLKDLYIELHDYSYFHSPSEIGQLDKRFTGRHEVLQHLKRLLTDHETPAGAYLITGYRGAGKSSLVAQAISELSPVRNRGNRGPRFARLLVLLAPFAILGPLFERPLVLAVFALAWLKLFSWHILCDPQYPDLVSKKNAMPRRRRYAINLKELTKAFFQPNTWLLVHHERSPSHRHRVMLHDLTISIFLGYCSCLAAQYYGLAFFGRCKAVAILFILLVLYNIALWAHLGHKREPNNKSRSNEKTSDQKFLRIWKQVKEYSAATYAKGKAEASRIGRSVDLAIKNYIRFASRITIKINLSQDNLQERDILRLIAQSVHLNYRQFISRWTYDLPWKFIKLVMIFGLCTTIFNIPHLRSLNEGLVSDFHIPCLLPSQGAFALDGGSETYKKVLIDLADKDALTENALRDQLEETRMSASGRFQSHGRPFFRHDFPSGLLSKTAKTATTVLFRIDTFIQQAYFLLYEALPAVSKKWQINHLFSSDSVRQSALFAIPRHINYLFISYLYLLWHLPYWLQGLSPESATHRRVLKRLEELNEMIEAQVTRERGGVPIQANSILTFSFGLRKSQSFPVLNERDIEKHLLEIMALIRRIPRFTSRPEFIIIFDELDKIQPHTNFTLSEQDDLDLLPEPKIRELASFEAERERQQRILGLVSNLKHFFTTCPAKFIFIAGREMFDASLADVSDRHFFMGSVFNQVLHVPSFLSDNSDDRLPDITSLTEEYLCRFLLPRAFWSLGLRLQTYNTYLTETVLPGNDSLTSQRREKIIYELHNFITYVTYRSNGAPKKVTKTIERFLVSSPPNQQNDRDSLIAGLSSKSFYLRFGYYDQYSFDIITYLASPLIFSLNRAIKDYGDKILVSSSFLLDHIYKFHGGGFSWRNLELLPEIVDINRAPQLRELISSIMSFLAKSDVVKITGGLYDFKFSRKPTEEISFLSKISEYESAAFNFTLDESLALKRHFSRKLQQLLKTYGKYPNSGEGRFINAISYVRMILGDLHFYDGDLDNAIAEYMEAVQSLRNRKPGDLPTDLLVLSVRNLLKLGLAFEKRRSYDSALMAFGKAALIVSEQASLLQRQLAPPSEYFKLSVFHSVHLFFQPIFAHVALTEKLAPGGLTEVNLQDCIRALKHSMVSRRPRQNSDFLIEATFKNKLADLVFFKNGPAVSGTPYCQTPRALCTPNDSRPKLLVAGRRLPCQACLLYHDSFQILVGNLVPKMGGSGWILPRLFQGISDYQEDAFREVFLAELASTLSDLGNTFLSCSFDATLNTSYCRHLLRSLRPLGIKTTRNLQGGILQYFSSCFAYAHCSLQRKEDRRPNKLEEAFAYYLAAALLFRSCSRSSSCAQELTKVLWVVREHSVQVKDLDPVLHKVLGQWLVRNALLVESYRSHEATHRLEIEKLKEIFSVQSDERRSSNSVNLGRISINSGTAEIFVLLDEIALSKAAPDKLYDFDLRNSPHGMFHSVYSRIHILRLRGSINYHNIQAVSVFSKARCPPCLNQYFGGENAPAASVARALYDTVTAKWNLSKSSSLVADCESVFSYITFLITDSIYCWHEIMRLMAIYGSTYMASHTMRASAHRNLSMWCDICYAYSRWLKVLKESHSGLSVPEPPDPEVAWSTIDETLEILVGKADVIDLGPNYHADLAIVHFKAAKETHTEGSAYGELLDKMYYLCDDFSDQLEHFCAALERFQINSGAIDRAVEALEKRLAKTSIFNVNMYENSGATSLPYR